MTDAEKKARLAEQLRANLRKRKAQAREVAAQARGDSSPGPEGSGAAESPRRS